MTLLRRIPPRFLFWGLLLVPLAVLPLDGAIDAGATEKVSLRIRVEWGGAKLPKVWAGTFEVSGDNSRLLDPVSLAIEADQPGRVRLEGSRLSIRPASARTYDGFDVTVESDRDAELELALAPPGETAKPIRFGLAELLAHPINELLDDRGNHVWFRRAPGDELRVELDRDHLVFRPGEEFRCNVRLNLVSPTEDGRRPGREEYAELAWKLVRARTGELAGARSFQHPEQFPDGLIRQVVTVPPNEGVYDLRFALKGRGLPTLERVVQLVVLEPRRPETEEAQPNLLDKIKFLSRETGVDLKLPGDDAGSLKLIEVDSFHPAASNFGRRFFSSNDSRTITIPPFDKLLATGDHGWPGFPPAASSPPVSWVAYGLAIKHPGEPHLLEVEYPDWHEQTLGISLVEPNAAGKVMPLGVDSGVYTIAQPDSPRQLRVHRLLFWPRTNEPLVLLTNRRSGEPALIGKITVNEIKGHFHREGASGDEAGRLAGPYLEKPLFPENFGAAEAPDGPRSLDDWLTFYQGATRLVDYLHYSGQNSLALTVLADGSTIYPSRLLEPTPRHDTGVFFSTGQDPLRKDVLELVFSLFDREGFHLIPVLQFAAPLPALERQLEGPEDEIAGIELVGDDGQTWRESRATNRGLAQYYSPIDPRVQEAMRDVVRELLERYSHHRSFAGIGIEASAGGYAALPGVGWGYDDATVERFAHDTGVQVPGKANDPARFATRKAFLTGEQKRSWLRWRAERLAAFYRALRDTVVDTRHDAKLYLMGNNLIREGHGDGDPYEALSQGASLERLLANKGIDPALYRDEASLVLMRTLRIASLDRHPGGALDEDFNTSPELDGLHRNLKQRGALFIHEPYACRLPEFDEIGIWNEIYTWLVAQPVPSGRWILEPYAHALASLDPGAIFDGGWMIPLGAEPTTRGWIRTFLALPDVPFQDQDEDDKQASQPVTIRMSRWHDETVFYLVNDFPWEVHVQLELKCPPDAPLRRLGPGAELDVEPSSEHGRRVAFGLKGFGLQAFAVGATGVKLVRTHVVPDSRGLEAIQTKFDRLNASAQVLKNREDSVGAGETFRTGFEDARLNELPEGWQVVPAAEHAAETVADEFHQGKRSLRFGVEDSAATLLGPSFPRPQGRMVGVWVWMRSAEQPAPVRIAFEGRYREQPYLRPYTIRVEPEWKPYLLRIFDLPADGIDSLRVRFDLTKPGTIWIDDLLVTLDPLTEDELRELRKTVFILRTFKKESRWADCHRILGSYWARFLMAHWPADATVEESAPDKTVKNRGRLFRR